MLNVINLSAGAAGAAGAAPAHPLEISIARQALVNAFRDGPHGRFHGGVGDGILKHGVQVVDIAGVVRDGTIKIECDPLTEGADDHGVLTHAVTVLPPLVVLPWQHGAQVWSQSYHQTNGNAPGVDIKVEVVMHP